MRDKKTGPTLMALAMAAALVIGGCGGGGSTSTGAMKHENGAAMHDGKGAMQKDGAAHDKMNNHGGSMHEG